MSDDQDNNTVDRRRLLRRAGTVAAGLAGTSVVGAVAATSAQAAPGDPVVQGADNNAGNTTVVRSSSDTATLQLANSKVITGANGRVITAPTLRLAPSGTGISDVDAGSMGVDTAGNLWVASGRYGGFFQSDRVHTSSNSNRIVPIIPQRVIDTRTEQGRWSLFEPDGKLDSAGRLLGGRTVEVNLARYVFVGEAVFGSVTVTGPLAGGYLQIYPAGIPRPSSTSTITFETSQTVTTGFMSGMNWNTDRISVYAHRTTHIIIDVVAFVIGFGEVFPQVLLPTNEWIPALPEPAAVAEQRRPSWTQGD